MPIPVSPVNRKCDLMFGQLFLQSGHQVPILFVDGAFAIEVVVMLRDVQHALARDILSAQNIFQKRDDVRLLLRTAKRNYQDCLVGHRLNGHRLNGHELSHRAVPERLCFQSNSYDGTEKRLPPNTFGVEARPNVSRRGLRNALRFNRTIPPEPGPCSIPIADNCERRAWTGPLLATRKPQPVATPQPPRPRLPNPRRCPHEPTKAPTQTSAAATVSWSRYLLNSLPQTPTGFDLPRLASPKWSACMAPV